MSFWRRSCLVVAYLLLVVVSSWLLEWILLVENGSTTYQIVDPLRNLSVSQLQALLDGRGIQYTTLLEKREIIEALQSSGSVKYMELLSATYINPVTIGPNEIVGKDEFYEQVLEENESIWVVEIIPGEGQYAGHRVLDESSWLELDGRLKSIGVNTAVIRCYKDPKLCSRQGWSLPQLVMAVPKIDSIGKESFSYPSTTHLPVNAVMNWIHKELSGMICKIQAPEELEKIWLNTTIVKERKIPQMVFFSELLNPPLLLVTLGLRFSSRIRLAIYHVGRSDKDQVIKTLHKHKLNVPPSIVVASADNLSTYGNRKGETMTVTALDIYIRLLQPRMNDLFLISLVVTNLFAFVDLLDGRGSFWRRVIRTLFSVPIHNVLFFIIWLTLTAVMKFSWMSPLLETGGWLVHKLSSLKIADVLLYHVLLAASFFYDLSLTALFMFWILLYCWRCVVGRPVQDNEEPINENWFTIFPMDSYLVNVLFRPMASLSRPRPSHDFVLEEGMERLIERLATPDLWLHPVLPSEYIKDLPSWRYDGWGNEDDLKSESETDFDSLSENENEKLLELHTCCRDEGCKMCTLWATVKETYVCHRCAILKRKLEKRYLRYRDSGDSIHQNYTYEKLLRVCENCFRTKKHQTNQSKDIHQHERRKQWFLSAQRLNELKWTAPKHAIESRVCAICLDKYRWSAVLCGLPCGHTYHHSCIMEWLTKDNHQCPTCRWPSYKSKVVIIEPYLAD